MGKIELKPCPFCGGEYTQVRWIGFTHTHNGAFEAGYRGECAECFAITRAYNTAEEAAEAWNTRHEPKPTCDGCVDEHWGDNCEHCIRYHRLSDCYRTEED